MPNQDGGLEERTQESPAARAVGCAGVGRSAPGGRSQAAGAEAAGRASPARGAWPGPADSRDRTDSPRAWPASRVQAGGGVARGVCRLQSQDWLSHLRVLGSGQPLAPDRRSVEQPVAVPRHAGLQSVPGRATQPLLGPLR